MLDSTSRKATDSQAMNGYHVGAAVEWDTRNGTRWGVIHSFYSDGYAFITRGDKAGASTIATSRFRKVSPADPFAGIVDVPTNDGWDT